ncbi:Prokaryotic ATPase, AAA superfamily [Pyrococcus sp. NA2]|uniref:AAA family ATPase n=1 Tax=Pyrococcus sp. (strain NA2) TaxID=342949 RepID=UPI000209A985|nr:ATP-binding protein [Pyrococcus sp. NA2]AEC51891.1 Prokaryotic ATPase, AAA superfamily [Pyrococcus sp. NA2]
MLFDLRPKERREEIFDREKEFRELEKSVESYPITLLLGIRRVGKSSILKSYLNENPGILIDCRELYAESGHITKEDLTRELRSKINSLEKILSKFKMSIDLKFLKLEPKETPLREIFRELNEIGERTGRFIIAFDEAQYLRFYGSRGGKELLALLAYAYDSLPNLRFILTGSEVGLLHDFLGIDDYKSPLYGRIAGEVYVKPFSPEISREFLITGFREVNVEVPEEVIDRAVEVLDGIPGWLVLFGVEYLRSKNPEKALERTLETARGLILGELKELERRTRRYVEILRGIALGYNRWSLLRDYLYVRGIRTPEPRLYELLKNLKKMGWIVEENEVYKLSDPLTRIALL